MAKFPKFNEGFSFRKLLPHHVASDGEKLVIGRAGETKEIEIPLTEAVIRRIILYGLKQIISDCYAGKNSNEVSLEDIANRIKGERKSGGANLLKEISELKKQFKEGKLNKNELAKKIAELIGD